MKWILKEAKYGDIVRVKLGDIYHYGIFASKDEIIQFGLPPTDLRMDYKKVEVCISDLETFVCGKHIEVGEFENGELKKKRTPEEVVESARKRIGERGYHILYNNCEHFARECACGEKYCGQVEMVREMWKSFPFVNIYVKKYPFDILNNDVYPKERAEEINSCGNQDVKNEKFYVWKLLEHGLKHSLGKNIKDFNFTKNGYKWTCDKCNFSLSHTGNLVAVAVARNSVGVDIEEIDFERFEKIPSEKILTRNEIDQNKNMQKKRLITHLNRLWTIKESIFKKNNDNAFAPTKIEVDEYSHITKIVDVGGEKYFLSVATDNINIIKFHADKDIKIEEDV